MNLLKALASSPFALIPPFTRSGVQSDWYRLKSHGSVRESNKFVTLNVEGAGSIQYVIHNDALSDANYHNISVNHLENNIILINTDWLQKSILSEEETMVLAMTGHVLTKRGMCEIMTSMKIDGILEKGFN